MRQHRFSPPIVEAEQAHIRQRIVRTLLTLPIDKWVGYPIEEIEAAFQPISERLAFLRRDPAPFQPITTKDQLDTLCAQEGLAYDVDPLTERHIFKRRRVPCPSCEAIGTILMVDSDYRPRSVDGPPGPMVCSSFVTCTICKGSCQVAASREPGAIFMNGERVR